MAMPACSQCSSPHAKACVCGGAAYCNTACQRSAWPSHKAECSVVSVKNRTMLVNRSINSSQIIASIAPLLSLDISDPASFDSLLHQFKGLDVINKQQVLERFDDVDIYKTMESPVLRGNKSFKAFIQTISLEEFEILMKVIRVMNNQGIFYKKQCHFFPNIKITTEPNCTISENLAADGLIMFHVKSVGIMPRGTVVTVAKNSQMVVDQDIGDESAYHNTKDEIEIVFKALDCDKDGYLTMAEFENALNLIMEFSREEAQDLFIKADYDCDGKLGLEDFMRFVRKYR